MKNVQVEDLISLEEAANILPRRKGGRKYRASSVRRWATVGFRGFVLETVRVGGSLYTSREAIQRFLEKLTAGAAGPFTPPVTGQESSPLSEV